MNARLSVGLVLALFSCGPVPASGFDDLDLTGEVVVAVPDAGPTIPVGVDAGSMHGGGVGGSGGSSGGGGGGSGGGAVGPTSSLAFLFPNLQIAYQTIELVSDRQGVMHAAFKMLSPTDTILDERPSLLFYARCAANCGQPSGWSRVEVGTGFDPHLDVGADGTVHVVFATDGGWNGKDGFRYARCLADCLVAANWSAATLFDADFGVRIRGRRAIRVGPTGSVAAVFIANGDLYFVECVSSCLNPGPWSIVLLDDVAGQKTQASLALTTTGQPRVVASLPDSGVLRYFSCEKWCMTPVSWSRTSPFAAMPGTAVLQLDAQNRPRVLFNKEGSGPESDQYRTWYVGCDSNCTVPSNWAGISVGAKYEGDQGADLAWVDGKPVIALEGATGAVLYRCTSGCSTLSPTFSSTVLETDAQLTALVAPTNLMGCTNPVWNSGRRPVIAADPTGKHLTALFEAISVTFCASQYGWASNTLRVFDLVVP